MFRKRLRRFAARVFLIFILLELTLFNYQSYLLLGGQYTAFQISLSDAELTGLEAVDEAAGTYRATSSRPAVTFQNINRPLRTLSWAAASENGKRYRLAVQIAYKDEAHSLFYDSPKKLQIVRGYSRSGYTSCEYVGTVGALKLTLEAEAGEILHLESLSLNPWIPFRFSLLRLLVLPLALIALYALVKAPAFRVPYSKESREHRAALALATGLCLFLTLFVFFFYTGGYNPFTNTTGDQLSKELVDAFEAGQVSLLDTPSEELLALENPYDYQARKISKVSAKWDHVLYKGKYYSYYGIAPVLTLFLPYHLLTGYYLSTDFACLLYSLFGVLFLIGLYLAMVRRWFPSIPFRMMLAGLLMLYLTSGVLLCVNRPMFYEVAESAGFMFLAAGMWALVSSGVVGRKKGEAVRPWPVALSSVCISLAVLSRPTMALYVLGLLPWLVSGLLALRKAKAPRGRIAGYVLAAALPYLLFGGLQIAYNYARFGSPLEFGIRYSLTINDFTHARFYPKMMAVSLWNFLFAAPVFQTSFPFFAVNGDTLGLNGFYYCEYGAINAIGVFWRALPLFSLAALPVIMRKLNRRQKLRGWLLAALPGILVPLLAIALTWQSGYAQRYTIDFAWQMLLAALALIFWQYGKLPDSSSRKWASRLFLAALIPCLLINLALAFQYAPGTVNTVYLFPEGTTLYYHMAGALEFWN